MAPLHQRAVQRVGRQVQGLDQAGQGRLGLHQVRGVPDQGLGELLRVGQVVAQAAAGGDQAVIVPGGGGWAMAQS